MDENVEDIEEIEEQYDFNGHSITEESHFEPISLGSNQDSYLSSDDNSTTLQIPNASSSILAETAKIKKYIKHNINVLPDLQEALKDLIENTNTSIHIAEKLVDLFSDTQNELNTLLKSYMVKFNKSFKNIEKLTKHKEAIEGFKKKLHNFECSITNINVYLTTLENKIDKLEGSNGQNESQLMTPSSIIRSSNLESSLKTPKNTRTNSSIHFPKLNSALNRRVTIQSPISSPTNRTALDSPFDTPIQPSRKQLTDEANETPTGEFVTGSSILPSNMLPNFSFVPKGTDLIDQYLKESLQHPGGHTLYNVRILRVKSEDSWLYQGCSQCRKSIMRQCNCFGSRVVMYFNPNVILVDNFQAQLVCKIFHDNFKKMIQSCELDYMQENIRDSNKIFSPMFLRSFSCRIVKQQLQGFGVSYVLLLPHIQ